MSPFPDSAPPRLVADTNVLLDWLVFGHPDSARWLDAVRAGQLLWCVSPAVLAEYRHMAEPSRWARWAGQTAAAGVTLESLSPLMHLQPEPHPPLNRPRCSDRDDQMFVDLALAVAPARLLTRDRALLKLRRRLLALDVTVVEPAEAVSDARAAHHDQVVAVDELGLLRVAQQGGDLR